MEPIEDVVDFRTWEHGEVVRSTPVLEDDLAETPSKMISRPSGTVLLQDSIYLLTAE